MRLDELKKGLWGYKKEDVYRYIVGMEEESSRKLAEKDAKLTEKDTRMAQQETRAQSRSEELERLVETLQEENASLKANQSAVFATLLEAQRHAERLREESIRREQKSQEELKIQVQRQTQKLESYSARVQQLREVLRELMVEFDGRAEQTGAAMDDLKKQAPQISPSPAAGTTPKRPDPEGDPWKKLLSI